MKNNQILQGSEAWLEAKQSKISASEIFTLVRHYCAKELEELNFDLKEEKSFRSIQELFLKVKFGAKLSDIDPIHSQFGNGLEPYVAYRLGQELPETRIERSKEFIVNEALHPLAACSPDGYIETMNDYILFDFDKKKEINSLWGCGAMELKTANYFANFGADAGSKLHYIMQLQFQLMVMGLKWGCLAVLMPKEKEFDDPFFKGKILGMLELSDVIKTKDGGRFSENAMEGLNEYYDLKYYIYPELPAFQQMIMKSLNAFQSDLGAYDTDPSVFPRESEDLAGLQREKAMWAQLWPNEKHLGKKLLETQDQLNNLLNERYQAQVEYMFAEQAKEKVECEIRELVTREKLDKHTEIIGTENRMMWIKNGQVRFYKINKK